MDSGFYATFTGLAAQAQTLDLLANNIANASTIGFKGQRAFYRALTASVAGANLSPLNRAMNNFSVLGGGNLDLRQGSLERTGNDLDVAIEGGGFLSVQTPAGVRFTRAGSLHLDPTLHLLNADGAPVLGQQGPIQLPPGPVSIGPDGTISAGGAVADRLRLTEFPPGTELTPEGNANFSAPAGTEKPAASSQVVEGSLETSNVSPVEGTVTLIQLQRHFEMLERTLSIFHNVFDESAAEVLPRV